MYSNPPSQVRTVSSLLAKSRSPSLAFDKCCIILPLGPAVPLSVSRLGKQHAMMYSSAYLGFCAPKAAAVAIIVGLEKEMSLVGSLVPISRRPLRQVPR